MTKKTLIGWTVGDGSGHEGYRVEDYFDAGGKYLGPDAHGIEPIFDVEMVPCPFSSCSWIGPEDEISTHAEQHD